MTKPPKRPGIPRFAIGDVVHLISGSPRMTVINVDDEVEVAWVVFETAELRSATLPAAALKEDK